MDDLSRKTWIYFLKKKDKAFSWFHSFKALVENQTGKKIKILRTDNGTENELNEFKYYCREVGLRRRLLPHILLCKMALLKGRTVLS